MAVKIVRQPRSIVLLGAPTSAASLKSGHEQAPEALRAAGLAERLKAAGFEVNDQGDCAKRTFQADDEHPRARNLEEVLASVEELRPKVEVAVKSGALPLILGGDDSVVLAAIAGTRRYYKNLGLVYMDRDGGLNVPASTPSGCVDGMVISHVIGRGAPEMVRFWGEPPLVREPEIALFGTDRLDEPEEQYLKSSILHRYGAAEIAQLGAAAAAERAVESVHGHQHEFVLHVDLDVISGEDFHAANLSAAGGLRLADFRQALAVFARKPKLGSLVISAYNPELDPDGTAARQLIDLLVEALTPRMEAAAEGEAEKAESTEDAESAPAATASGESVAAAPAAAPAPAEAGGEAAKEEAAPAPEAPSETASASGTEAAGSTDAGEPSSGSESEPPAEPDAAAKSEESGS